MDGNDSNEIDALLVLRPNVRVTERGIYVTYYMYVPFVVAKKILEKAGAPMIIGKVKGDTVVYVHVRAKLEPVSYVVAVIDRNTEKEDGSEEEIDEKEKEFAKTILEYLVRMGGEQ